MNAKSANNNTTGMKLNRIEKIEHMYRLTDCCLPHWVGTRHLHYAAEMPGVATMEIKTGIKSVL